MAQSSVESPARFEDLKLSPAMMGAIEAAGYTEPTPIQAGLIPRALAGVDVLGQARTGTGKTAAFTIPILETIEIGKKHAGAQALVLVPTRELAVQVREEVVKLSHGQKVHSVAIYGGKPIKGQIDKLRKGAEVVIGTPGRILDHLARGTLELRDLKIVVLDEADRMLDIGFRPDIEKILRRCPQSRQTLLLSATVPPPVEKLSKRYMRDPETLNFSPKDVSVETIEQFYFTVDGTRKFELLEKLLEREQPRQAIIFCRTKRGTEKIYQRLTKKLRDVAAIHGDLAQGARDRVMAGFRAGTVRYLVATDVVGRGIDVSNISHIINYDIPQFCDDYVHRVGRTGRMGREGVAYTFVSPEEGNELTRIEMRINRLLVRGEMLGFAASGSDQRPALPTNGSGAVATLAGEAQDSVPPAADAPPSKPSGRRYRRAL
jgi:ATP-dependent RNA helicase DeaD